MIINWLGNVRTGKTLNMTIWAVIAVYFAYKKLDKKSMERLTNANEEIEYSKKLPANKDTIVMANYKIDVPNFKYFGINELLELVSLIEDGDEYDLENCILCLDEIWSILESRVSLAKINRLMSYFIMQSGKADVQILYTAQLNKMADGRLRDLANISHKCRKDKKRRKFIYNLTSETGFTKTYSIPFEQASRFYPLYDTKFKIPLASIKITKALKKKADDKRKQEQLERKLEKAIQK